jgi:phage repressor protein C with HTH and peptisase S24 domain
MLTHKQVWNAIDTIAERYGYSASGLAEKSGLDPTSFNPSKRTGPDGRPRWPTMEGVILEDDWSHDHGASFPSRASVPNF